MATSPQRKKNGAVPQPSSEYEIHRSRIDDGKMYGERVENSGAGRSNAARSGAVDLLPARLQR